ncbi:hypothetical protein CSKR_100015 [Clonorchis sinensis]|uniref:Uncharacterized protein n=1 Tax=Clonorchis sinensis TaxID=79923 RepID=A0A3R7D9A3_CLOSI|nr:hypothetical protein CSKR_100015 [Clonorchis sinensis]
MESQGSFGILWLNITGQVEWVTANQVLQTRHCRSSKLGKMRGKRVISRINCLK